MSKLLFSLIKRRCIFNGPSRLNRYQSTLSNSKKHTAESDEFAFEARDQDQKAQQDAGSMRLTPNIPEAEEALEQQVKYREYVERARDVSRMPRQNALRKLKQHLPIEYSDKDAQYLKTAKYFRKMYARYGQASGVEAALAWPSKQQLETLVKDEQEYDLTLRQKIEMLAERKQKEFDNYKKL